jgi:hypothetical protein
MALLKIFIFSAKHSSLKNTYYIFFRFPLFFYFIFFFFFFFFFVLFLLEASTSPLFSFCFPGRDLPVPEYSSLLSILYAFSSFLVLFYRRTYTHTKTKETREVEGERLTKRGRSCKPVKKSRGK